MVTASPVRRPNDAMCIEKDLFAGLISRQFLPGSIFDSHADRSVGSRVQLQIRGVRFNSAIASFRMIRFLQHTSCRCITLGVFLLSERARMLLSVAFCFDILQTLL